MELSTKRNFIILTSVLITIILVVTLSIVFTKNNSQTDFDNTTSTFSSKLVSIDQGDLEGIVIKDLNNAVEFYNIPYRRFFDDDFSHRSIFCSMSMVDQFVSEFARV